MNKKLSVQSLSISSVDNKYTVLYVSPIAWLLMTELDHFTVYLITYIFLDNLVLLRL